MASSEDPTARFAELVHSHFLDQLEERAYFADEAAAVPKPEAQPASAANTHYSYVYETYAALASGLFFLGSLRRQDQDVAVPETDDTRSSHQKTCHQNKLALHACVVVSSVTGVDAAAGRFSARYRVFLMWRETDPELAGVVESLAAQREPHEPYYALTDEEADVLARQIELPRARVTNAIETVETDAPALRAYGGSRGASYLLWNAAYASTLEHAFDLALFPFDTQRLAVEVALDHARVWKRFDLRVHAVLFARAAVLDGGASEWIARAPQLERGGERRSTIRLVVSRNARYYVVNVFAIMALLSAANLLAFLIPPDDLPNRLNVTLTLLLTTVAFKFAVSDTLPKVAYACFFDTFMERLFFFSFVVCAVCAVHALHLRRDDDDATTSSAAATHVLFSTTTTTKSSSASDDAAFETQRRPASSPAGAWLWTDDAAIANAAGLLAVLLGSWVRHVRRAVLDAAALHGPPVIALAAGPAARPAGPHHHQNNHRSRRPLWYCFRFEFPAFLPPPRDGEDASS